MRCFNHHGAEAVGLCKACSRALCLDCAAEAEGGLACRDRHEGEVAAMSQLIAANTAASQVGPMHYALLALLVAGAVGCVVAIAMVERLPVSEAIRYLFFIPAIMLGGQVGGLAQWILVRRASAARLGAQSRGSS